MSLLMVQELSLRYGPKIILDDESFALAPDDRVGLVGPNGTGKSTLLKILAGAQAADTGELQWMRGARVGYLAQELGGLPDGPLVEAVLSQVPGRTRLQEERAALERALESTHDEEELLELSQRLVDLQDALDHHEARFGRHKAEEILLGLGFRTGDLMRRCDTLSGGWRMRAALASLLLTDPDLLLLDEPTNHLDVPTLAWFDDFLRRSRRAIVLVSHDREFLNRQIRRVISFEPEGLRSYVGGYDDYKRQRAAESDQLRGRAERQARKRAEMEAFIERFRAKATKARQVKSREKMLEREERVELYEERKVVAFQFPEAPRSGREVLRLAQVHKRYGDRVVYDGLERQLLRGDRVAIVGANGAGKTTLLKMAAGELLPDTGEVAQGHGVIVGYYAQHHTESLDPRATILEQIARLVPDKPQSWVRSVLGSFLFSGTDVDKRIAVLSGGERARVALARLLVAPGNLLLMDEPTNHLDLDSAEALVEALKGYAGTLVFVSHNRSFVNQLATKVWEVDGGNVHEWPGNLDDYLHRKALAQAAAGDAGGDATDRTSPPAAAISDKERRRLEAEARQTRSAREKPVRQEIARLEKEIERLESLRSAAEAALADPELYADFDRARPHMESFERSGAELEALYARWEEQQLLLEG